MNNIPTWANLVEQFRNKLYRYLSYVNTELMDYESYLIDEVTYQDQLLKHGNPYSYFVDIITLMKSYGINDDFLNEVKNKNVPLWIREQFYNDLLSIENNPSDEVFIDLMDLLHLVYTQY